MLNIKGIIFDMDGVLLDTETMCDNIYPIAAEEQNVVLSIDVINSFRGMNFSDTIAFLNGHFGTNFDAATFLNRCSQIFREQELSTGIPLMPYSLDILKYLKPKYKIALASSTKGKSVERQMKNAGMIDYFQTLTTGDMVQHSKPDPEIYTLACKSINLPPQECVAIEDSPNGVKSALAAGLKVIMVPDKLQPDENLKKSIWKICKSLKDIEDIL